MRIPILYVLEDRKPVPQPDPTKWAIWIGNHENRVIKQTECGDAFVSTIFYGVDMGPPGRTPRMFETAVLMDDNSEHEEVHGLRYETYEEAVAGHDAIVARLRG